MTNDPDPGWGPSLRTLWWSVIPLVGFVMRTRARRRETNGLILLRRIYLGPFGALILYPVAFSFIGPWDGGDEGWAPWAVAFVGVVSLVGVVWVHRRQLPTTSPEALAASYRGLFFLGIGVAEASALVGMAGVLLRGSFWVCLVGLPFAFVGMWMVAPSRSDIERRQREITATGSPLSLVDALVSAPPSRP
jgi:hypothetical protein